MIFGNKKKLPAEKKLDKLLGEHDYSENVISSKDLILMDVKIYYKDSDKYDLFKNVGRIFRLPGALRIATYNKEKSTFSDNLVPLTKIKKAEMYFRTITGKSFAKLDEE